MKTLSNTLNSTFNCLEFRNTTLFQKHQKEPNSSYLADPLNIGRSIARKAVNTHFILSCDIEFSPSFGVVDKFLDMVHRHKDKFAEMPGKKRRVYVFPVFQVIDKKLPDNKHELVQLYQNMQAHLINTENCPNCDMVTDFLQWLNYTGNDNGAMEIFNKNLRGQNKHWQPYYISNNKEPFFDKRVISQGRYNQRVQVRREYIRSTFLYIFLLLLTELCYVSNGL